MPRFKGVYRDANGWYFKARTSKDPLTGKWSQITRRGSRRRRRQHEPVRNSWTRRVEGERPCVGQCGQRCLLRPTRTRRRVETSGKDRRSGGAIADWCLRGSSVRHVAENVTVSIPALDDGNPDRPYAERHRKAR